MNCCKWILLPEVVLAVEISQVIQLNTIIIMVPISRLFIPVKAHHMMTDTFDILTKNIKIHKSTISWIYSLFTQHDFTIVVSNNFRIEIIHQKERRQEPVAIRADDQFLVFFFIPRVSFNYSLHSFVWHNRSPFRQL